MFKKPLQSCLLLLCCLVLSSHAAFAFVQSAPLTTPDRYLFDDSEIVLFSASFDSNTIERVEVAPKNDALTQMDTVTHHSHRTERFGRPAGRLYSSIHAVANGRFTMGLKDQQVVAFSDCENNTMEGVTVGFVDSTNGFKHKTDFEGTAIHDNELEVAAGEIDELLDDDGAMHDDIVLARLEPFRDDSPQKLWKVDFLDNTLTSFFSTELSVGDTPLADEYGSNHFIHSAIGDFDGDGYMEVALLSVVSRLSYNALGTLYIIHHEFVNNVMTYIVETAIETPLDSPYADITAGDFDGDGKWEIAIATSHSVQIYKLLLNWKVEAKGKAYTGNQISGGCNVEVDSGLFQYDVDSGYGFNRKQIALARGGKGHDIISVALSVDDDFNMHETRVWKINTASTYVEFDMDVGNLVGHGAEGQKTSPLQQIVLLHQRELMNENALATYNVMNPATGSNRGFTLTYKAQQPGVSIHTYPHVVTSDIDGDSWILGAPVRIKTQDILVLHSEIQEPPKHIDYLPLDPAHPEEEWVVFNDMASDDFYVETKDAESTAFSSSNTFEVGAGTKSVESLTWKGNFTVKVPKIVKLEENVSVKVGLETSTHFKYSRLDDKYEQRTLEYKGRTTRDDLLQFSLQHYELWLYTVTGLPGDESAGAPHACYYTVISETPHYSSLGGLACSDWFQPVYQNKNILTYPNAIALGDNFPEDLGLIKTMAGKYVGVMNDMYTYEVGGTSQSINVNWTDVLKGEDSFSWGGSLKESLDTHFGASGKLNIPGKGCNLSVGSGIEHDLGFELQQSLGDTHVTSNTSTMSKGISLNIPPIDSSHAYLFKTAMYITGDSGTLKVAHAVDPTGSTEGELWWTRQYGRLPDPALNLPKRFASRSGEYVLNEQDDRMCMRGFFLQHAERDLNTGEHGILNGPPVSGETVRLCARIYNNSLGQSALNVDVLFETVQLDEASGTEIEGTRVEVGRTTIDFLASYNANNGPSYKEATVNWDTTGLSTLHPYRFYVTVDPDDTITELHEWKDQYGVKIAHGNNEGYWPWGSGGEKITVPDADNGVDAKVESPFEMDEFSMALVAEDEDGTRDFHTSGRIEVEQGKKYRVRVRVSSDSSEKSYRYLVFSDGSYMDMEIDAIERVAVTEGVSYVWFEWTPEKLGETQLHTYFLPADDDEPDETLDVVVIAAKDEDGDSNGGCVMGQTVDASLVLLLAGAALLALLRRSRR